MSSILNIDYIMNTFMNIIMPPVPPERNTIKKEENNTIELETSNNDMHSPLPNPISIKQEEQKQEEQKQEEQKQEEQITSNLETSNNERLYLFHPDEIDPILSNNPTFVPGEFLYVKDINSREMLQNGWNAVNQLELWSYMEKKIESYTYSRDKEVDKIGNKMIELGYDMHSGCSFGWTMRKIQFIAQNGEQKFMENWILST
jgi:hypothetical protein